MGSSMILTDGQQTGDEACFVGGKPVLPRGNAIPKCALCRAEQTFFLQVAFPDDHVWTGLSLAVFSCTSCADKNHLIPEMLSGVLTGADIPANFLNVYQLNFHFVVFETAQGQLVRQYQERVRFRPICLERADSKHRIGQVGGGPAWILEDESPESYDAHDPMYFLFQVDGSIEFETVQGAPPQMEVGLTGDPEPSPHDFYQLFIGNAVYLFGAGRQTPALVYAITQVN